MIQRKPAEELRDWARGGWKLVGMGVSYKIPLKSAEDY